MAEEISRELGLTIANEVYKQKLYQNTHADPVREAVKAQLREIAYSELGCKYPSAEDFFDALSHHGVEIEQVKNKKGSVFGLRFHYQGQRFKASEIGQEFGLRSIYNQHDQTFAGQRGQSQVLKYEPTEPEREKLVEIFNQQDSGPGFFEELENSIAYGSDEDEISNEWQRRKKRKITL